MIADVIQRAGQLSDRLSKVLRRIADELADEDLSAELLQLRRRATELERDIKDFCARVIARLAGGG